MLRAADRMRQREQAIWRQADLSLYPSEEEADIAAALQPGCGIRPIVPYSFERFAAPRAAPAGSEIIFVAGFGHPPNEDAACWFVAEVLPLVRQQVPEAFLSIIGSNPTAAVRALAGAGAAAEDTGAGDDGAEAAIAGYGAPGDGANKDSVAGDGAVKAGATAGDAGEDGAAGPGAATDAAASGGVEDAATSRGVAIFANVSDAELAAAYARARVAVVPLRCGAGVKLKVVEALREGVPLVTTPVGAQGLPGIWQVVAVAEEAAPFAAAVVALLRDDAAWESGCSAQLAFGRRHFSGDAMRTTLLGTLGIKQPGPTQPDVKSNGPQRDEAHEQAA